MGIDKNIRGAKILGQIARGTKGPPLIKIGGKFQHRNLQGLSTKIGT